MRSGARSLGIAVDLKMDLKERLIANLIDVQTEPRKDKTYELFIDHV